MSKGSKRRPENAERYRNNYADIFEKKIPCENHGVLECKPCNEEKLTNENTDRSRGV